VDWSHLSKYILVIPSSVLDCIATMRTRAAAVELGVTSDHFQCWACKVALNVSCLHKVDSTFLQHEQQNL
jgi:hypothetical protein